MPQKIGHSAGMKSTARLNSVLATLSGLSAAGLVSAAVTNVVDGRVFTLADGFTLSRASTTNLVLRPVNATLDPRGRLFVTDSSGSSEDPKTQAKDPQWRVVRLDDTDGDGIYDRSTVVADHLPMLQGILWHESGLYIGGTPSIWKLTDFDAEGRATKRTEWWNVGRPSTHCGNEVHGPYAGPDGYIYWTKGAFEPVSWTNSVTGRIYQDRAAHIFRARPDGSAMESVMSGGMDNPVEVAFTPDGELLFTSTFIDFTQPGFRDGLAHASYGSVFGKQNDNIEDRAVKRTGPELLHPIVELGAAAPSGLCRYDSAQFGREFQDNFFASLFNLRKITRHALQPSGATFTSVNSDFVVTEDLDFHPTDVLADTDGTLLIVDTGGWYKLCCPSSQLWKPDVLGTIYRVRKDGAAHSSSASATALKSNPIAPSVKARATALQHEPAAVPGLLRQLEGVPDVVTTSIVIATLTEIGAREPLRAGLTASSPGVQRGVLIALAEMDDSDLKPTEVTRFLGSQDAPLREAAQWIVKRRPHWGAELAGWFQQELATPGAHEDLASLLPILTGSDAGRHLLGELVARPNVKLMTAAMEAIAGSGLKVVPDEWWPAFVQCLVLASPTSSSLFDRERVEAAIHAARGLSGNSAFAKNLADPLAAAAANEGVRPAFRLEALALAAPGRSLTRAEFAYLRGALLPSVVPAWRSLAVEALTHARLSSEQQRSLLVEVRAVGPLEFGRLLGAYDAGGEESLGLALVEAVRQSASVRALLPSQLQPHFAKFPASVATAANSLLAELAPDTLKQSAHITSLLTELQAMPRSVRHGQAIFNSPKAACSACHRIGYQGGNIGPDLTSISNSRSERDLLEAVVYPSASFVRSYEPLLVSTKSGDDVSGIVRRETETELILATGPGVEQRVAKADVTDRRPGTVSVMPAGLDTQLSKQELADLIAFLKNTKWGAQ